MKNVLFALALALALILSGCQATAPSFNVNVDSISVPASNELKRYILLPNNEGVNVDNLQFQEYAGYVERALTDQGFVKATDFDDANVAIFVGYGIGDPQTNQYTYSIPTWGKTGVSSSNTNSTVNAYGNTATINSTTTYTPTYGITGSTTGTRVSTTYTRFLFVSALDLNQYKINGQTKQIWKTSVISTGSSGDLRQVLPILVAASKTYLSKNTGKMINVSIKEEDKRVLAVKGITTN
jgi:hypothetical protein